MKNLKEREMKLEVVKKERNATVQCKRLTVIGTEHVGTMEVPPDYLYCPPGSTVSRLAPYSIQTRYILY